MRISVAALALIGLGATAWVAADAPAAPAASATEAAKPAVSPDEQRLLSQGYKPEMRNGQKIYCRREHVMGSRTDMAEHCGTVDQLKRSSQDARDQTDRAQRNLGNPGGH